MLAGSAFANALAAVFASYSINDHVHDTFAPKLICNQTSSVSNQPQHNAQNYLQRKRKEIIEQPTKRIMMSKVLPAATIAIPSTPFIFSLALELFIMVATPLSDQDLYNLTQVCHHMANIICPLFLSRRDFRLDPNSHTLRDRAFQALPIWLRWRRSSAFIPVRSLYCWLSPNMEKGEVQLEYLRATFMSLPSQSTFRGVYIYLAPMTQERCLDFLPSILRTGCSNITISALSSPYIHPKPIYSTHSLTTLRGLEELTLRFRNFTSFHWATLLSHLTVPSLQRFTICGNVSISAICNFLSRHPNVCRLQFLSSCEATPKFAGCTVVLPLLEDLGGTACHVLTLLQYAAAPCPLQSLDVHDDKLIHPSFDMYLEAVAGCLELCQNPLCLFMTMSGDFDLSAVEAVRRFQQISYWTRVRSLTIIFEDAADDLILTFCGEWLERLPALKKIAIRNHHDKGLPSNKEVLYDDCRRLVIVP